MQLAKQPEYDDLLSATFTQSTVPSRSAFLPATSGYFGAGFTTWDVALPDLAAIGFNAAWGLASVETHWTVSAYSIAGVGSLLNAIPADGVTMQYAARAGRRTF